MRKIWSFVSRVFLVVMSMMTVMMTGPSAVALSESEMQIYSDNNIYFYDPSACKNGAYNYNSGIAVTGGTMEEKIWNGLNTFMSPEQAAGVMGNILHEGAMNPVLHESQYQSSGRDIFTDTQVSYGIGLVQWSWGRRINVLDYIMSRNPNLKQYFTGHSYNKNYTSGDLFYEQLSSEIGEAEASNVADELVSLELSWLKNEMEHSREMNLSDRDWAEYFSINDVEEAAVYFLWYIESPNDKAGQKPIRVADAKKFYELFANGGATTGNAGTTGGNTVSAGGCTQLTSAPDYNESGYQGRLGNLHHLSQLRGTGDYGAELMNPNVTASICNDGESQCTISYAGCGIMSVFATFYMFSGQGVNDMELFREFREATINDNDYNQTSASKVTNYGERSQMVTQMVKEDLFDYGSYQGDKWDTILEALNNGKKVVILVSEKDGSLFTTKGHYMMIDHYDAERDKMYLFDPAANQGYKKTNLKPYVSSGDVEYYNGDMSDGMYITRNALDTIVKPKSASAFSYGGCYNGGSYVNVCRPDYTVASGLLNGGMNYDEAVNFVAAYREEASKKYFGAYGLGYANGTVIGDGYVGDAGCKDGTLNNCVAFSRWFVNNYTTVGPNSRAAGDGWAYAGALISTDGFVDNGRTPSVYSVFSRTGGSWGHTGVVLGIDASKDEIYIGEAGCTGGFITSGNGKNDWPGVHIYSLSEFTDGDYVYAYPGDKLKV